jgi:hypothetical protein
VPPEVKKIDPGEVFSNWAMLLRALSTIIFDSLPKECVDEGLAKKFFIILLIISIISGAIGVVAALSKYTFI